MKRLIILVFTWLILCLSFAPGGYSDSYSTENFKPGFCVEYPKAWHARERKDKVTGITNLIFTQDNPTGDLQGYVSISAVDSGVVSSLNGFADDILARRAKLKDMKLISDSKASVANMSARNIVLSYGGRNRLEASSRDIIIRQRLVIFQKDNNYFTFKYESPQESYEDNIKVFENMLKSLKFN